MKTNIYLVRHGEIINRNDILYARLPGFRLSQNGREQIKQTAEFLRNESINEIYSSPLLRTRQTAEIIRNKLNLRKTHTSQDLLEIKTSFQARSMAYMKQINYDIFFSPKRKSTDETMEQVLCRMKKFIFFINKKFRGERVIAVSHGDPIMIIKAAIVGLPMTNDSIRGGKNGEYVWHGEVLKITVGDENQLSIKSIFKPLKKF